MTEERFFAYLRGLLWLVVFAMGIFCFSRGWVNGIAFTVTAAAVYGIIAMVEAKEEGNNV